MLGGPFRPRVRSLSYQSPGTDALGKNKGAEAWPDRGKPPAQGGLDRGIDAGADPRRAGFGASLEGFFRRSHRAVGDRRRVLHAFAAANGAGDRDVCGRRRGEGNPAVVTILNLQPISEADLSGFPGSTDFPTCPDPRHRWLPRHRRGTGADEDGTEQIEDSVDSDTLVPAGTGPDSSSTSGRVVTNARRRGRRGANCRTGRRHRGAGHSCRQRRTARRGDPEAGSPAGESVPGVAIRRSSSLRPTIRWPSATRWGRSRTQSAKARSRDEIVPSEGGLTTWIQHDAEIWHGNLVAPCSTCAVRSSASIPPASAPA